MTPYSRRSFIKASTLSAAALAGNLPGKALSFFNTNGELQSLSLQLATQWAEALLRLQVTDPASPHYGALVYPPEEKIHGRIGDSFYPFLYFAHRNNDKRFLDAAILLYRWMEKTVSQDDGSWLNEPVKNSWKGTTVFTSIALGEALTYHGQILEPAFRDQIKDRLRGSGDYILKNFTIDYGNINYPVAGSWCLTLLGKLLNNDKYKARGKELAHAALKYFSKNDHFLYGEGTPKDITSPKGCFSIDLGYNVEESLPSLVQYAKLTGDQEVLQAAIKSMRTHLEFMLPDGGWDNSWGTRNYKWTYWGSRTSDGCQPAYALLADKDPAFYQAALKNTGLLLTCTHNGILHGGPHYASHDVPVSLHHTFCHLKALVTILDHHIPAPTDSLVQLPREKEYGSRFFTDIQTILVAKGKFRGTITAYDRDYKEFTGGHATGGALSLLWHEQAGLIFSASMNEYQLIESGNMQKDTDPLSMPLTPRMELKQDGIVYSNIQDNAATMKESKKGNELIIETEAKLVNNKQQSPAAGVIKCMIKYHFTGEKVVIHFSHNNSRAGNPIQIILPVISPSTEEIISGSRLITFKRQSQSLTLRADRDFLTLPVGTTGRIFNFVPGLEALPLCIEGENVVVEIELYNIA